DGDALGIQISGHPGGIANHRKRPRDQQSVVARQHPGDPVVVAFRQRLAHVAPRRQCCRAGYIRPIGSGSAGLGVSMARTPAKRAKKTAPAKKASPLKKASPVKLAVKQVAVDADQVRVDLDKLLKSLEGLGWLLSGKSSSVPRS